MCTGHPSVSGTHLCLPPPLTDLLGTSTMCAAKETHGVLQRFNHVILMEVVDRNAANFHKYAVR